MDGNKKLFRLDLSIAVEADSADEAYEILIKDDTLSQIKGLINKSQGSIKEMFQKDEKEIIIN